MRIIKFLIVFFLITALCCNGQNNKMIDSLRNVIPGMRDDDPKKAELMNSLAFEISYISLDSGLALAFKTLDLATRTNNTSAIAFCNNTIGTVYHDEGDFQKAVQHYNIARQFAEKAGNKSMLATVYANMGNTYSSVKDYKSAKYYLFESLKIFKALKRTDHYAGTFMNIGVLYSDMHQPDSAMYYYKQSLATPFRDPGQMAILRFNLSEIYLNTNRFNESEKELLIGLKLIKELNSVYYDAAFSQQLGKLYRFKKQYPQAEKLILKSITSAKSGKLLNLEVQGNYEMFEICRGQKLYDKALKYHLEYALLHDSINNIERGNAARELEKKYQSEKKQVQIEKLNAEKLISESENKQKNQLLVGALLGVLIVLCALAFAISAFINKRKANEKLELLNKEVLIQKDELQDKNKNITDSIHYAQRIQNVLLTSSGYIKESLENVFILNKPKDIVSGDFYWAVRQDNSFYFMVADCTGHGVPGAFMSLLGINFLNEIVIEHKINHPAEILNNLRSEIMNVFTDKGNTHSEINDGMDCVLCKFDLQTNVLQYAAANNSIVIVRGNETIQLTGDKMPVGKSPRDHEFFTEHSFQLFQGDMLYMFTDGFPDQFGGSSGKKLKVKNVKQLLATIATQPIENQRITLNESFENWKGNLEQVDDVLMVGIRV